MIRRRDRPDGLPFRVYERHGVRDYSIGHKGTDGKWTFRYKCSIHDKRQIIELRREAITRAAQVGLGGPARNSFSALIDEWIARQEKLPPRSAEKRADSTLAENKREAENLRKAFGSMLVSDLENADAYAYLDACLMAVDKEGNPRPRPEKGNKEIALARVILEYGIRTGTIKSNPFDGVDKLATSKRDHYVTDQELSLAVEVGPAHGRTSAHCPRPEDRISLLAAVR